jgi:hypothetical protein
MAICVRIISGLIKPNLLEIDIGADNIEHQVGGYARGPTLKLLGSEQIIEVRIK